MLHAMMIEEEDVEPTTAEHLLAIALDVCAEEIGADPAREPSPDEAAPEAGG